MVNGHGAGCGVWGVGCGELGVTLLGGVGGNLRVCFLCLAFLRGTLEGVGAIAFPRQILF
ncbi:MAG: hypothetical protein F6J93_19515 [Oscillatoria sp. SIO1A7]|nr:hypothetical protein [Oscillatoria sp. SIO1A7]